MDDIRILCYGDSNTWGAMPYTLRRYPGKVRWTGILREELGTGWEVIEEGYNSRTTVFDDLAEGRLSGLTYFGPCCVSQSPLGLLILMLGTNDLKVRFGMEAITSAQALQRYLDQLPVLPMDGGRPEVLLMAPPRISPAYKRLPEYVANLGTDADRRSEGFGEAVKALAVKNGTHFLNAADYAWPSDTDGVHLTVEGHRKLGIAVAEAVRKIFKREKDTGGEE